MLFSCWPMLETGDVAPAGDGSAGPAAAGVESSSAGGGGPSAKPRRPPAEKVAEKLGGSGPRMDACSMKITSSTRVGLSRRRLPLSTSSGEPGDMGGSAAYRSPWLLLLWWWNAGRMPWLTSSIALRNCEEKQTNKQKPDEIRCLGRVRFANETGSLTSPTTYPNQDDQTRSKEIDILSRNEIHKNGLMCS